MFFMNQLIWLGQIALSMFLGGILGWQREYVGKSAGIRTYALVTAGSALFTILSMHAFGSASDERVAAQIVSGIGFIGAGTILHKENRIEGLTTAAGLWMASAIGMAVASEYYILSSFGTILIFILLVIDEKKWLMPRKKETNS